MPLDYERKTADIFLSDKMKNVLEMIKDKSNIAKLLLYKRIDKSLMIDDYVNYIGVSENDSSKISYLTKDRINDIEKSSTLDYWDSNKRIACRPGTFLSKIFKDVAPRDVENFANLYKTFSTNRNIEFKVVQGDLIKDYYSYTNYYQQNGSLGSSCMKSDSCQEYFDIYTKNDNISLLILLEKETQLVIGRALLWNFGGDKVMDRIYTVQDDIYFYYFTKWATDNGYVYKTFQSWSKTVTFNDGNSDFEKHYDIRLEHFDMTKFPYVDTFKWLNIKTGVLTNYKPKTDESKVLTLTCANGYTERYGYLGFCEVDREYCYNGDLVQIVKLNGDTITCNSRNCNYSYTYEKYLLKSESKYFEQLEDYIYSTIEGNDEPSIHRRLSYVQKHRSSRPLPNNIDIYSYLGMKLDSEPTDTTQPIVTNQGEDLFTQIPINPETHTQVDSSPNVNIEYIDIPNIENYITNYSNFLGQRGRRTSNRIVINPSIVIDSLSGEFLSDVTSTNTDELI